MPFIRSLKPVHVSRTIRLVNPVTTAEFRQGLNDLFIKRATTTTRKERAEFNKEINRRVVAYNEDVLQSDTEFDMHGMTPDGAVEYVLRKVGELRKDKELILITGRGNHSKGGRSAVRDELIGWSQGRTDCTIREDSTNPGRLKLTIESKS